QVPAAVLVLPLAADDFHRQVRAVPELFVDAADVLLRHEDQVRLPEFAPPQPHPQRREQDSPQVLCGYEGQQQAIQVGNDLLVRSRRHGQYVEITVREFHQTVGVEVEVFLLAPGALGRE